MHIPGEFASGLSAETSRRHRTCSLSPWEQHTEQPPGREAHRPPSEKRPGKDGRGGGKRALTGREEAPGPPIHSTCVWNHTPTAADPPVHTSSLPRRLHLRCAPVQSATRGSHTEGVSHAPEVWPGTDATCIKQATGEGNGLGLYDKTLPVSHRLPSAVVRGEG